jgi:GGDEF domain-containing protein
MSVCHWGPLSLPNTENLDCRQYLQQLCKIIAGRMNAAGLEIIASIGFVTFYDPPEPVSKALARVDQSMYQAKRSGKGRVDDAA